MLYEKILEKNCSDHMCKADGDLFIKMQDFVAAKVPLLMEGGNTYAFYYFVQTC